MSAPVKVPGRSCASVCAFLSNLEIVRRSGACISWENCSLSRLWLRWESFSAWWTTRPGRWYAVATAACVLVVVSMFFVYFGRANATFSRGDLPANELRVEFNRWAAWHWVRSGLSLVAVTAAILAAWQ